MRAARRTPVVVIQVLVLAALASVQLTMPSYSLDQPSVPIVLNG